MKYDPIRFRVKHLGLRTFAFAVALIVAVSLYCTVILAKALGCALPMTAKKLGFDPALMASPLITTVVDMASLTIYFTIATAVMRQVGMM